MLCCGRLCLFRYRQFAFCSHLVLDTKQTWRSTNFVHRKYVALHGTAVMFDPFSNSFGHEFYINFKYFSAILSP